MDPMSQIIGLLKPQAVFWRVVEAHDAWTIGFRPTNIVVFGQMIEGSCHVEREDGISLDLAKGDFMLMAAPPKWTMAALGGGTTKLDFGTVIENPQLLVSAERSGQVTRFMAGNFAFSVANRDLISSLMLPIVHVRGKEIAAARLAALLTTFGEEATWDRPGRSLVLERLLELVLLEALRYRPADIGDGRSSLLAGLEDPKIGNALRVMHSDQKRAWTLATLAREVGMSRSAFALRFTETVECLPSNTWQTGV